MARKKKTACCPSKIKLDGRPLLTERQGRALESTFKVLANGTRLRMLHALTRAEELCVTELGAVLGMKPQAVSNQLQRLADRGIVEPRRNGLQVYYRIVDPCTVGVLEEAWCLLECANTRLSERMNTERIAS